MHTHEDIITHIAMHSKVSTPEAIEFTSKLGFNTYYRPLSKNNQWYQI